MFGKNFLSHGIEIITNMNDGEIIGNENELLQVVINIFNNSKDILISQKLDKKLILVNIYTTNDNNIVLTIKDNGGGIDDTILSKIFDAYFTTKHKSVGTGIGLYMSYQIVTNSFKGNLIATNERYFYEDKSYYGASFTITIPINNKI
jgi:signal transduction histidine kinase